jgi:hypothetical protein
MNIRVSKHQPQITEACSHEWESKQRWGPMAIGHWPRAKAKDRTLHAPRFYELAIGQWLMAIGPQRCFTLPFTGATLNSIGPDYH